MFLLLSLLALLSVLAMGSQSLPVPWIKDSIQNKWVQNEWVAGCNFIPSNAVNELQMFQVETYDAATIDRELGFAESLGFRGIRVFLHNLLWERDSKAFINTLDSFLNVSSSHGIGVMLVLLDSCWNAYPLQGTQPNPIPYVHNSQWVQAPGFEIVHNTSKFQDLKPYIQGVVGHFKDDPRIIAWDVWNEPDNSGYSSDLISPLISQVFEWSREMQPTQPLTTPLWTDMPWDRYRKLSELEKIQITQSDVISFHSYSDLDGLQKATDALKSYNKPVVCTEYMARTAGSTFNPNLGYMKDQKVSAFNWGLVSGLSQTIYPWDSRNEPNPYSSEPDVWFHDILHADGSPRFSDEADYIRMITKAA